MTTKRIFIALVLLLTIIAVSYIKAVRQQEKVDRSFQLGQKASEREVLVAKSEVDSLITKLGKQEVAHAESLLSRDKFLQKNMDSLTQVIEAEEQKIENLQKKSTSAQQSNSSENRHRELLAYYKKRYESLPGDLSEYERKVAVSEIRQETAKKYSISVAELNRLRERYKLNF